MMASYFTTSIFSDSEYDFYPYIITIYLFFLSFWVCYCCNYEFILFNMFVIAR